MDGWSVAVHDRELAVQILWKTESYIISCFRNPSQAAPINGRRIIWPLLFLMTAALRESDHLQSIIPYSL